MPIKPSRAKNRRKDLSANVLTDQRYENLTSFMNTVLNGDIFLSKENREKCYRTNKKEIMKRWFADPENLFERPYCFWQFEKLPAREIVGYERWWNPIDKNPPDWEVSPVFENDIQFLSRLGMLSKEEIEKYKEDDRENIFRNHGLIHCGET